ncbi:MAG: hypothetical protein WC683_19260 [bacterium]
MPRTASFVIKTPQVLVNNVDLSDTVQEAEITLSKAMLDDTSSGDNALHYTPGLEQNKASITFRQSFEAAKVDATLYALWAADTEFELKVAPASGTNSATNPAWVFDAVIGDYVPLSGKVGDLLPVKQDFVINSVVSRDIT